MASDMQDIAVGTTLAFLIMMQGFIIWECVRMKSSFGTHSTDLRTELGNLGSLLDEALDFMNDAIPQPQGIVANTLASPDIKEVLLQSFLSKMMMPPEHGSPQEPQDRQNDEISTQVKTETQLG